MADKKRTKKITKKLDIAEHEYRLHALGMSERAKRLLLRGTLILIPILFVLYWILKTK
jgi:hypothetical protein